MPNLLNTATVSIFDDNTATMLAHFTIYSKDHIAVKTHHGRTSEPCPMWRFEEWFSFANRCGHVILVAVWRGDKRVTYEFQVEQTK